MRIAQVCARFVFEIFDAHFLSTRGSKFSTSSVIMNSEVGHRAAQRLSCTDIVTAWVVVTKTVIFGDLAHCLSSASRSIKSRAVAVKHIYKSEAGSQ